MADDLETLVRWEDAGGTWRVVGRGPSSATVSLCRCDGGEQVDRLASSDDRLLAYVAGRESSDEPWLRPSDPAG
ncbi:hypothetical protein [Mumia sp. DW29H23]|uniref:hypothetical protein n=1 Tax=Mumia sp. DW29H23 TaxID=3421241 RepID=UPI003D69003E